MVTCEMFNALSLLPLSNWWSPIVIFLGLSSNIEIMLNVARKADVYFDQINHVVVGLVLISYKYTCAIQLVMIYHPMHTHKIK